VISNRLSGCVTGDLARYEKAFFAALTIQQSSMVLYGISNICEGIEWEIQTGRIVRSVSFLALGGLVPWSLCHKCSSRQLILQVSHVQWSLLCSTSSTSKVNVYSVKLDQVDFEGRTLIEPTWTRPMAGWTTPQKCSDNRSTTRPSGSCKPVRTSIMEVRKHKIAIWSWCSLCLNLIMVSGITYTPQLFILIEYLVIPCYFTSVNHMQIFGIIIRKSVLQNFHRRMWKLRKFGPSFEKPYCVLSSLRHGSPVVDWCRYVLRVRPCS